MMRTFDGRINFWNSSAEALYGWRKEEAIGKISHNLLRTEFPKPLHEIEAEVIRNRLWEGKLVHATRDGRRVVVDSRWVLDPNGDPTDVVEINTSSDEGTSDVASRPTAGSAEIRMDSVRRTPLPNAFEHLPKMGTIILALWAFLSVIVVLHGLFGDHLIKAVYDDKLPWITGWLMGSKAVTPREDYYLASDRLVLLWTLRLFVFVPIAVLLIKRPLGALIASCSVLLCSFVLFCIVEWFPVLKRPLQSLPFYSLRENWTADNVLSYRGKPFANTLSYNFRGDLYSAAYGIDVDPISGEAALDEDGFRNSHAPESPDIIVLGDSYVEHGFSNADTFPQRLEANLSGLTVLNLGKSGYGPHQYVEILRRYGIPKSPTYALFGFFEGNDIWNMGSYVRWKNGDRSEDYARIYDILSAQTLLRKYSIAFSETVRHVSQTIHRQIDASAQAFFQRFSSRPDPGRLIHPDVAVLSLGDKKLKVVFPANGSVMGTADEMLRSKEFDLLRQLLAEFRYLCVSNNIIPIIVYLPTANHIYAEYSTQESGRNWLARRAREVATKGNLEGAVRALSEELQIEFISVSPALERAAEEGKLLYHRADSHWNSEGKEVAARFVAGALEKRFLSK